LEGKFNYCKNKLNILFLAKK
jgi:hypothetical protein